MKLCKFSFRFRLFRLSRITIAFLVFAILGGYVYLYEVRYTRIKEQKEEEVKKVFTIRKTEIAEMRFAFPDRETIVVKKAEDDWKLLEPLSADADDQELEYLSSRAEEMKIQQRVSEKNWAEFGLDIPSLVLTLKDAKGKTEQISLGKKTPVGWYVYARRGEEVFLVDEAFFTNFSVDLEKLRNRRLFRFEPEKVSRISIRTPEHSFTIQKEGNLFWLTEPERKPASSRGWDNFLRTMEFLEVSSFFPGSLNLQEYSFEPPLFALAIAFPGKEKDQEEIQEVRLGKKEGEEIWATRWGSGEFGKLSYSSIRSIVEHPEQLVKRVPIEVDSFEVARIEGKFEKKSFRLEKRQEKWYRIRPKPAMVDWTDINEFLDPITQYPAEAVSPAENLSVQSALELTFLDEKKKLLGKLVGGAKGDRWLFFSPEEKWEYEYSEADSQKFLSAFKKVSGMMTEKKEKQESAPSDS